MLEISILINSGDASEDVFDMFDCLVPPIYGLLWSNPFIRGQQAVDLSYLPIKSGVEKLFEI